VVDGKQRRIVQWQLSENTKDLNTRPTAKSVFDPLAHGQNDCKF